MAHIEVTELNLIITPEKSRKAWTLHKSLAIPLSHIADVSVVDVNDSWDLAPHPLKKLYGTNAVGLYYGGLFKKNGEKIFYDLKKGETALVINLKENKKFHKIILGFATLDEANANAAKLKI